jgi:predicted TIM-barrel fold metal-dependent hydrolase
MALPAGFRICDPHFHFWDHSVLPNVNLGDIVEKVPAYTPSLYAADMAAAGLNVVSAVHVEAIVGQMEGGAKLDPVAETRWVVEHLTAHKAAVGEAAPNTHLVPYVHLARDDAAELIAQHRAAAGDAFVGVRMIVNFKDDDASICWPQVGRGDFLTGGVPAFKDG